MAVEAGVIKTEIKTEDDCVPTLPLVSIVKKEEDSDWEAADVKLESELILSDCDDGVYPQDFFPDSKQLTSLPNTVPAGSFEKCQEEFPRHVVILEEGIVDGRISPPQEDPLGGELTEVDIADEIKSENNGRGNMTVPHWERKLSFIVQNEETDIAPSRSVKKSDRIYKPFVCEKCPARFKCKSKLIAHLVVHSDEKAFSCDKCLACFKRKSSLTKHLAVHSEKRAFSCRKCLARFKGKVELASHLLIHSEKKAFSCDMCLARFKRKHHLEDHLASHSNQRPFRCDVCFAQFKTKRNLKRHLVRHPDEKLSSRNGESMEIKISEGVKSVTHSNEENTMIVANKISKESFNIQTEGTNIHQSTSFQTSNLFYDKLFADEKCSSQFKRSSLLSDCEEDILQADTTPASFLEQCPNRFFENVVNLEENITDGRSSLSEEVPLRGEPKELEISDGINDLTHSNERGEVIISNKESKHPLITRTEDTNTPQSTTVQASDLFYDKPFDGEKCFSQFKDTSLLLNFKELISQKDETPASLPKQFPERLLENVIVMEEGSMRDQLIVNGIKTHSSKEKEITESKSKRKKSLTIQTKDMNVAPNMKVDASDTTFVKPFALEKCSSQFKHSSLLSDCKQQVSHGNTTSAGSLEQLPNRLPKSVMELEEGVIDGRICSSRKDPLRSESTDSEMGDGIKTTTPSSERDKVTVPNSRRKQVFIIRTEAPEFNPSTSFQTADSIYKPFVSNKRPAHFKRKDSLKSHLASHSNERPFCCDKCPRHFKRKGELSAHMLTHSDKKAFSCDMCLACFKRKDTLKTHLGTHSNERPFYCDMCGARFKHKDNLRSHLVSHSNEQPFCCDKCGAHFKRKGALKKHLVQKTCSRRS